MCFAIVAAVVVFKFKPALLVAAVAVVAVILV
jgi:hypothetical protein